MKVSIVICTYNGEKFISNQLKSIISCLRKEFISNSEVLIFDDGSTDHTVDLVNEFMTENKDINIVFSINQNNLGYRKNFEQGIKSASGQYIFFCDQDDIWCEEKISIMISELENSDSQVAFSNGFLIDEFGNRLGKSLWERVGLSERKVKKIEDNPKELCKLILKKDIVTGCTLCMKKGFRKFCLPFPEHFVHDTWIANIAALSGKLKIINNKLICYRLHQNQNVGLQKKQVTTGTNRKIKLSDNITKDSLLLSHISNQNQYVFSSDLASKIEFYKDRLHPSFFSILFNIFRGRYKQFTSSSFSFLADLLFLMGRKQ